MILLVLIVLAIIGATPTNCNGPLRRVIFDQDAGGDDSWALIMLLMNEAKYNVRVEAITCSHGNTDVDNVANNVARILDALGRTDVPVYKGARESLITPPPDPSTSHYFWGLNGFADVRFNTTPNLKVIQQDHAVLKMRQLLLQYPKQVTILATAPLTNVALLFKMFPEVKQHIADIYILGGNRDGVGNTAFASEFNFYTDPEAANIVLNNSPVKLHIFPWETILALETTFTTQWRFQEFRNTKNKAIQVLNEVEAVVYRNISGWTPCDMYMAAVLMRGNLVTKAVQFEAEVELSGRLTRGMLTIFHTVKNASLFNVDIIYDVDRTAMMQMVIELNREPSSTKPTQLG